MGTTRVRSSLRHAVCWTATIAAFSMGSSAWAATQGQGRGYGLDVTANVGTVIGLTVPLGDTGNQTAPRPTPPLDFHVQSPVVQANVTVGVPVVVNALSVKTGDIYGKTDSALAQNKVDSEAKVLGLDVGAVGLLGADLLKLKADSVTAEAHYTCGPSGPVASGKTEIVGLTASGALGSLLMANPLMPSANALLDAPANTGISVSVLGVASLTLMINEQTTAADKFTVNGLHLALNVASLINTEVTVAHAEATMPNCAAAPGSVTIAVPPISTANQAAVPVTGQCTAGGGNVQITSAPAGVNTSVSCGANGTYTASVDASGLDDGTITFTASQDGVTANTQVVKNTAASTPVVTVDASPNITGANASNYGNTPLVSGTCTAGQGNVTVTIGGLPAGSVACSAGGTWQLASDVNVSSLPDGNVEIKAAQGSGQGSAFATKDTTAPAVAILAAPSINATNVASYTFSGSCSENGLPVNINVASPLEAVGPAPICTGSAWSVTRSMSGLNSGNVTIDATQTDANGNTTTPPAERIVLKDVTAPIVTVTTPAEINAGNQASYTASGTCTVGDGAVTVIIGGLQRTAQCMGTPAGSQGTWTVSGVNVSGLPQSPPAVQITAKQTDAAGNEGSGQGEANKTTPASDDTTPPTVTVTAPPIGPGNQGSYQPSGTCEAGSSDVTVIIGVGLPGAVSVTAACNSNGAWTAPPTNVSGLPQGPITVTGTQSDSAGNTGSGQAQTTKSTPAGGGNGGNGNVAAVPVGGPWVGLLLLASGLGFLRRRKHKA